MSSQILWVVNTSPRNIRPLTSLLLITLLTINGPWLSLYPDKASAKPVERPVSNSNSWLREFTLILIAARLVDQSMSTLLRNVLLIITGCASRTKTTLASLNKRPLRLSPTELSGDLPAALNSKTVFAIRALPWCNSTALNPAKAPSIFVLPPA